MSVIQEPETGAELTAIEQWMVMVGRGYMDLFFPPDETTPWHEPKAAELAVVRECLAALPSTHRIVPAAQVPTAAQIEAIRFAKVFLEIGIQAVGDEICDEWVSAAWAAHPSPDIDNGTWQDHFAAIDALLAQESGK